MPREYIDPEDFGMDIDLEADEHDECEPDPDEAYDRWRDGDW